MSVRIFDGELVHQNPNCTRCGSRCYTLYSGGRKDKVDGLYFCKKCKIIYKLPPKKKCKYSEVNTFD